MGIYVDTESWASDGTVVQAWVWTGYPLGFASEESTSGDKYGFDKVMSQYVFDCARRRTGTVEQLEYSGRRIVRHDTGPFPPSSWVPESVDEMIGMRVCELAGL